MKVWVRQHCLAVSQKTIVMRCDELASNARGANIIYLYCCNSGMGCWQLLKVMICNDLVALAGGLLIIYFS
jgi:hypothetical protein